MKTRTSISLLVLAAAIAFAPAAQASAILYLNDGTTQLTIGDNLAGDANPASGAITYIGALGNWTLNVSTGITMPAIGSPTAPDMDLSSVNIGSGGLQVAFLSDGFSVNNAGFRTDFAGNSDAAVGSISALAGTAVPSPPPFSLTGFLYFGGFPTGGNFAGSGSALATLLPTDMLFVGVDLYSVDLSTTSFDLHTRSVPEPATATLLAGALVGLAVFGRRRARG
jgi:hypothetical protein